MNQKIPWYENNKNPENKLFWKRRRIPIGREYFHPSLPYKIPGVRAGELPSRTFYSPLEQSESYHRRNDPAPVQDSGSNWFFQVAETRLNPPVGVKIICCFYKTFFVLCCTDDG